MPGNTARDVVKLCCDLKDGGFHIETPAGQVVQILSTANRQVTGFGKHWLLEWPYLFISEPFAGTGKLFIYRWAQVKCRKYQFRLLKILKRPEAYRWAAVGFAQCFAWRDPFLFVTDVTYPNYRGSLFAFTITRKSELQPLYHHAPMYECVGHGIKVIDDEKDQTCLTVELAGYHRRSGAALQHAVRLMVKKHNQLEVILDEKDQHEE